MTRLEYELNDRKITLAKVAELTEVDPKTVRNWLNRVHDCPVTKAITIANFIGIPVDALFEEHTEQVVAKAA